MTGERILLDPQGPRRFAATTDRTVPPVAGGDELGILAHWWSMGDLTPTRDLGVDGHPPRARGLPPVDGRPVRMFAGGTVDRVRPLRAGEWVHVASDVAAVKETTSNDGRPLSFVEERYDLSDDDRVVVRETRSIVYTTPATPTGRRPADDPDTAWSREILPDERMLFRFSALTWNAHRIHYDLGFARSDGHPDLVVHGPLLAALLGDLWEGNADTPIRTFSFRALAPAFAGEAIRLVGGPSGRLAALDADGGQLMTAVATPAKGGPPWIST
jgi:3-methylfumaryl-CoA hydratase